MPTLSPTLRMLAACVFVMVIGVEAADARKKSPAQVLQEKFERQAAQLPKTCEQFRRLVTEGEPIFPPNSNPRLPASINHAVNMVIEDSRFSPVFGRPLDAFGEEDLRYFSDAYRHCTLSHPQPLADVSADAKRVLWEVFSIGFVSSE